jgi:hypothetical protein
MKTPTCQTVYFIALGVLSTIFLTLCPASGQDACKPAPPAGLKKGDLYYVAFITRNQRNATDKDINKYNQFVFDQAKNVCPTVLLHFSYRAIASTAAKSAKDNLKLKVTPPVYRVDGKRVVEHAEYLFGGLGLDNPVNIDERGGIEQRADCLDGYQLGRRIHESGWATRRRPRGNSRPPKQRREKLGANGSNYERPTSSPLRDQHSPESSIRRALPQTVISSVNKPI